MGEKKTRELQILLYFSREVVVGAVRAIPPGLPLRNDYKRYNGVKFACNSYYCVSDPLESPTDPFFIRIK
jgi:hypothetical protein